MAEEAAWEAKRVEVERKRTSAHHAATQNRQLRDMLAWQRLLARNPLEPVVRRAPRRRGRGARAARLSLRVRGSLAALNSRSRALRNDRRANRAPERGAVPETGRWAPGSALIRSLQTRGPGRGAPYGGCKADLRC